MSSRLQYITFCYKEDLSESLYRHYILDRILSLSLLGIRQYFLSAIRKPLISPLYFSHRRANPKLSPVWRMHCRADQTNIPPAAICSRRHISLPCFCPGPALVYIILSNPCIGSHGSIASQVIPGLSNLDPACGHRSIAL